MSSPANRLGVFVLEPPRRSTALRLSCSCTASQVSRFGGRGDLLQRLAPEPMADLAQGGALSLGQQQPAFQLGLEDAVLGGEILPFGRQLDGLATGMASAWGSERPILLTLH